MAYDKPKVDLVNKKYAAVTAGLQKMYGDLAKNKAAINKRNQAQQSKEIARIKKYQDRFIKKTEDGFLDARQITSNMGDATDTDKAMFYGQLNDQFAGGLNQIKEKIKSGASDVEIEAFVTEMIGNANTFTNGLVGMNSVISDRNEAFKNNADSNGTKPGSLVITDNYPGILDNLGGGDGQTNFEGIMLHGNMWDKGGVSVFIDGDDSKGLYEMEDTDGDGEPDAIKRDDVTGEKIVNTSEVLNLTQVGQDYGKGKLKLFEEVQTFKKYKQPVQTQINNNKKNPDFYKTITVVDADGNAVEKKFIDKSARNKYFLEGEGQTIVENIVKNGGDGLIQRVGGNKLLQAYTNSTDDAERQKIMDIVKMKVIEEIQPDLQPEADKALNMATFVSSRSYTEKDPGLDAKYKVALENEDDVKDVLFGPHRNATNHQIGLSGMNTAFKGKYIKSSNNATGTGHGKIIDIQETGSPNEFKIQIALSKDGSKTETLTYKLNTVEEKLQFERDMLWGQFPSSRADGQLQAMVNDAHEGKPKFDPGSKSSTTTRRKEYQGMSDADYDQMIEESQAFKTSDQMMDEYFGVQTQAPTSNVNQATSQVNQSNNTGTYNIAMAGTPSGTNISFAQNSNGKIPISINVEGADDSATSTNIAKVLNWENDHDYKDFGFTGAIDLDKLGIKDKIKTDNPNVKPGELTALAAEEAVNTYIIGGVDGTPKGEAYWKTTKKTSIVDNLDDGNGDFDRAKFDALPGEVKHYLIDYKVNATGRSAKDFMMLASGTLDWTGEDSRKYPPFPNTPEGNKKKAIYDGFDMANIDASTITARDLEIARRSLYLDGGTKPGGGDPGAPWNVDDSRSVANRMDISGIKTDRFDDIQMTKDDMSSNAKSVEFFINNKLLPGDIIKDDQGQFVRVPNY